MGILLGYSDVGYRVLISNKIVIARHVDFVEENIKCINLDENDHENISNASTDDELNDNIFESASETEDDQKYNVKGQDTKNVELKSPRRSTRDKRSPVRYPKNESQNIYVNYCRIDTPCTFEEAINSIDSKNWEKAMNQEIDCINKNKTWKLVDRIIGKKSLDVKWVYTRKSDDRYKARLVVRGFQQTDVVDDIYAPVAKNQTLKMLFSYCCQNGLKSSKWMLKRPF